MHQTFKYAICIKEGSLSGLSLRVSGIKPKLSLQKCRLQTHKTIFILRKIAYEFLDAQFLTKWWNCGNCQIGFWFSAFLMKTLKGRNWKFTFSFTFDDDRSLAPISEDFLLPQPYNYFLAANKMRKVCVRSSYASSHKYAELTAS